MSQKEEIMGSLGKYMSIAVFAFALVTGFAMISEAAEPDLYSIQQQIESKMIELDNEMASPNPNRGKIESLSKQIGELRGKELSARAGQGGRAYSDYGRRGYHRGYGWHHGGYHHGRGGCCW